MQDSSTALERLLGAIEADILPLTRRGVDAGNKVFGAALLAKATGKTVIAATNAETRNPLLHGEIAALNLFYDRPRGKRPPTSELVFLSTHEPCPMCLSAITWAGFDTIFYLFSHEDSRDAFAIPHDLRILKEVFGLPPGGYRRQNAYWTCRNMMELTDGLAEEATAGFDDRASAIREEYARLSAAYQAQKGHTDIPLN
jgi:tRNA(Arg) A34 adenosine deaminase TadA